MVARLTRSLCVVSLSLSCLTPPASAAFIEPERAREAMVVSAHPLATEAGIETLQSGGNAVDAAVATAFAISVVEPFSAGIGGGGFLLTYQSDTDEMRSLDFRERAPKLASEDMYLDRQGELIPRASLDGYLAAGVPGTVAGLYEVHQQYGELPWSDVVAPAIRLAREGFPVSRRFLRFAERRKDVLFNDPDARAIFSRDGEMYDLGDRLVQRDLARTLTRIAADPQSFYTGEIARAIAQDMAQRGGLVTRDDLAAYQPIWRDPLCGDFRQFRLCAMPPPSSGGVHILQILNILGDTDLNSLGWHHPDALHLLIEAMRVAYADRSKYLGDPDFVEIPVQALISEDYARQRRNEITLQQARRSEDVQPADPQVLQRIEAESTNTSHLTVVDGDRNALSLTFTINGGFGAGVVVRDTGIVLNNEMDDFAAAPGVPNLYGLVGGDANAIAPGKTPLSSMTPTIVTEDGEFRLATGSPGGSTIITTVLQILIHALVYEMDVGAAVSAPRLHHQWLPDRVLIERWGFDAATLEELRHRGHELKTFDGWGNANAIAVTEDGELEGAADPRGEGAAMGF